MTTSTGLKISDFTTTHNGKEVKLITLKNKNKCEACLSNFGANIVSFVVPDKNGKMTDIVLSQPTIKDMIEHSDRFLGATVGRYANRIAGGKFTLDGKEYKLPVNNGPNNLHTGPGGFHNVVWDIVSSKDNECVMKYVQPDNGDGFPGNLTTVLTFKLTDDNALSLEFVSETDKPTVVSITQHSFFNLTDPKDDCLETELEVMADFFTPVDENMIPTGEIRSVEGTPFDFRKPRKIGERINSDHEQIIKGTGYDHNFALRKRWYGELATAARATSKKSGIVLELITNSPGMQLYTANWMDGFPGKYGTTCPKRHAFCLEGGCFANTPNYAHFPTCLLRPGEKKVTQIIFKASVTK